MDITLSHTVSAASSTSAPILVDAGQSRQSESLSIDTDHINLIKQGDEYKALEDEKHVKLIIDQVNSTWDDKQSLCSACNVRACWNGCRELYNPFGQFGRYLKTKQKQIPKESNWHERALEHTLAAWSVRIFQSHGKRFTVYRLAMKTLEKDLCKDIENVIAGEKGTIHRLLWLDGDLVPEVSMAEQIALGLSRWERHYEQLVKQGCSKQEYESFKRGVEVNLGLEFIDDAQTEMPLEAHFIRSSGPEKATPSPKQGKTTSEVSHPRETSLPVNRKVQKDPKQRKTQGSQSTKNTQPKTNKAPEDQSDSINFAHPRPIMPPATWPIPVPEERSLWTKQYQPGCLKELGLTRGDFNVVITVSQGKLPSAKGPKRHKDGTIDTPSWRWSAYLCLSRVPGGWMSSVALKGMIAEWWGPTEDPNTRSFDAATSRNDEFCREAVDRIFGWRLTNIGETVVQGPGGAKSHKKDRVGGADVSSPSSLSRSSNGKRKRDELQTDAVPSSKR